MRKYVIGAIFGFLLSLSVSVYAEEVKNLVGAVIQGEFPVKVNGELLANKAIVVDGTSYLPVREFGEKLGMEVKFDADLGIELNRKVEEIPPATQIPNPVSEPEVPEVPEVPEMTLDEINASIDNIKGRLKTEEWRLKIAIEGNQKAEIIAQIQSDIDSYNAQIAELEAKKAELESK